MAREKGSVRIGPVSVFSLVIILGLAVLAVLSAATSHASNAEAQTQASFTASAYANDAAAAESLAAIDSALAREAAEQSDEGDAADDSGAARPDGIVGDSTSSRSDGAAGVFDVDSAMEAVSEVLPQGDLAEGITAASSIEGNAVQMVFSAQDGRTLTVSLEVCDNLTYEVTQWRVTTEWNQEPEENKLWSGE